MGVLLTFALLGFSNVQVLTVLDKEYLLYTPLIHTPWEYEAPFSIRVFSGKRKCAWSVRDVTSIIILSDSDLLRCVEPNEPTALVLTSSNKRIHMEIIDSIRFMATVSHLPQLHQRRNSFSSQVLDSARQTGPRDSAHRR